MTAIERSTAGVLLTTVELSQRWQVPIGSLANQRSARVGPPFVKLGGLIRYRLSDVESYEAARVIGMAHDSSRAAA